MATISGLSPAKVATLEAVIALTAELGTAPTYEQITARRGVRGNVVSQDLVVLQVRGWVQRTWAKQPDTHRGVATITRTDRPWPPAATATTESAAAA